MSIVDYLQNQKGLQNITSPAMLFSQSNKNSKFPDIYLFSNFGYSNSNSVFAKSEITSNYVESNVSVQDHWALPPIEYSLSGEVGEVLYIPPTTWSNFTQENITSFLEPISIISPLVGSYTQGAINLVKQVEFSVQRYGQMARQIYSTFGKNINSNVVSNQQYIYELLMELRNNRELVSIYTPYGKFLNMAITSINMRQSDTQFQSSLEVKLQQWLSVSETMTRQATETEKNSIAFIQKQRETKNAFSGKEEEGGTVFSNKLKRIIEKVKK